MASRASFNLVVDLPPELVLQIFAYLTVPDVFRAAAVCREWQKFIATWHQIVWRAASDTTLGGPLGEGNPKARAKEIYLTPQRLMLQHARKETPEAFVAAWAITHGHHRLLANLLSHHGEKLSARGSLADPRESRPVWKTVRFIERAARAGHASVVRVLLSHGASPRVFVHGSKSHISGRAPRSFSLLDLALARGNIEMVQLIYDALRALQPSATAPVSAELPIGHYLWRAAGQGRSSVVAWLLHLAGSERVAAVVNPAWAPPMRESRFESPLAAAAGGGHIDVMKMLLDHGALVNPPHGRSPIHAALRAGHVDATRLLLARGANSLCDPSKSASDPQPIDAAARSYRSAPVLRMLLFPAPEIEGTPAPPRMIIPVARPENIAIAAAAHWNHPVLEALADYDRRLLTCRGDAPLFAFCEASSDHGKHTVGGTRLLDLFTARLGAAHVLGARDVEGLTVLAWLARGAWPRVSALERYAVENTCLRAQIDVPLPDGTPLLQHY